MKNNKKIWRLFPVVIVTGLLVTQKALAVCPLCTIAVGAGVGLSRWLGIDDTITGLWVGGLIVSLIVWSENWLEKKKFIFRGRNILVAIGYYILTIVPLYYAGIIGNPLNPLCACGLDKLFLGVVVGSFAFWFSTNWYAYLKDKNHGHPYFSFQKIVMPISLLILISILFYFLTN